MTLISRAYGIATWGEVKMQKGGVAWYPWIILFQHFHHIDLQRTCFTSLNFLVIKKSPPKKNQVALPHFAMTGDVGLLAMCHMSCCHRFVTNHHNTNAKIISENCGNGQIIGMGVAESWSIHGQQLLLQSEVCLYWNDQGFSTPTFGHNHVRRELLLWRTAVEYTMLYSFTCCIVSLYMSISKVYPIGQESLKMWGYLKLR